MASIPVWSLNISPARCGVVPMPAEAKLSFPGLALPYATSSGNVFTGRVGLMTRTSGEELTIDYGEEWWSTRNLEPDP